MIYGIKQVLKYILRRDIAGRSLAVYPDDTFIVSYPRSGNTWTRFLIANLLHPEEPATFANIERLVPDSEAQSSWSLKQIRETTIHQEPSIFRSTVQEGASTSCAIRGTSRFPITTFKESTARLRTIIP